MSDDRASGEQGDQPINPFASPTVIRAEAPLDSDAELIRKKHINHEASVKSVGWLYLIAGSLGCFGLLMASSFATQAQINFSAHELLRILLYMTLFIIQIASGWGMRRLRPWSRVAGSLVAAIGLLSFPFGTVISCYILYLLVSRKGRTVFSQEYQRIIQETPHIKYRTSKIVVVLLILLLMVLAFGIATAVFSAR